MLVTINANNRSIKVLILFKADDATKTAPGCAMNRCINGRKSLDYGAGRGTFELAGLRNVWLWNHH